MVRHYLDYNATTPLDPRVRAVMEPYWDQLGNPSSLHAEGRRVRAAVDDARDRVAECLGVRSTEIIFTGGGTESNNLGVRGVAMARKNAGKQTHPELITSAIEHHAVLEVSESMKQREGFAWKMLPVDPVGQVSVEALRESLTAQTVLVSLMSANNETGVKQPWEEAAVLCAQQGVAFHTDAVQSVGKERLNLKSSAVTALSFTAHKFYGPVGAGVLYLRSGEPLEKLLFGGSQENTRRAGTENVAAIVGLAEAFALSQSEAMREQERLFPLVELLWSGLADLPGIQRNGATVQRVANTLNISFDGLDGEELLIGLDLAGLAVSSGSACLVGSVEPSHVLAAMGVPEKIARATVRISLGKGTQSLDIAEIALRIQRVVNQQRAARGG